MNSININKEIAYISPKDLTASLDIVLKKHLSEYEGKIKEVISPKNESNKKEISYAYITKINKILKIGIYEIERISGYVKINIEYEYESINIKKGDILTNKIALIIPQGVIIEINPVIKVFINSKYFNKGYDSSEKCIRHTFEVNDSEKEIITYRKDDSITFKILNINTKLNEGEMHCIGSLLKEE